MAHRPTNCGVNLLNHTLNAGSLLSRTKSRRRVAQWILQDLAPHLAHFHPGMNCLQGGTMQMIKSRCVTGTGKKGKKDDGGCVSVQDIRLARLFLAR